MRLWLFPAAPTDNPEYSVAPAVNAPVPHGPAVTLNNNSMSSLPIIDFGSFLTGPPEARHQIAREVDAALRTTGFIYLRNHGILHSTIEDLFVGMQ